MPTRRLVVLLGILVAPALQAQSGSLAGPARQAAQRITAANLERDLAYLASDELKGRNTPSPGFDTAAGYISARLEKAGLTPLGDNGGFRQHYVMRESTVDTAAASIEIGGRRFAFGDDFVMRALAAPVSGTFQAVYVGHGWTIASKGVDAFAGVDVKGKIVLAHGPRALPKGIDIPMIGRVNVGASAVIAEAHRRGAAAVVIIPPASAQSTWAQAREQNLVTRELQPPVPSAYAAVPITSVVIAPQVLEAIMAGERIDARTLLTRADAQDFPESFQLTKSIAVTVPAKSTDYQPFNVVAKLEGSDPVLRNEHVVIESHLDGAVGTRPVNGDDIYNSADDNATGSAANLAIAEALAAGPRPKRSFIFLWDSGEERGLWGTRQFVHKPPVPLDRIVAEINVDMIGANRAPGTPDAGEANTTGPNEVYVIGPGALSPRVNALLDSVNANYLNLRLNRDHDRPESELFYPRTDAGPFLERGILTIGFTTGIHARYHLPSDEARFLDPQKMEAIARTICAFAWTLGDTAERPRIEQPMPPTVPNYKQASYDVILRNGRIVDGSGSPWFRADVAIRGDTIVRIAPVISDAAARVIDVEGQVIAPGFIDIHTHARRGLFEVPTADNYVRQGVTTLIEGPDGSSPVPLAPFLMKLEGLRKSVNIGTFIGQGTVRSDVIGSINRAPSSAELDQMRVLVEQGMKDGAFGLSSGLFYVPGTFTPTSEVVDLAKVAARFGGIYISHMRNEAAGVVDSVKETIAIGERGGLPTQVTHHKIIGRPNWGKSAETLRLVDEARERGVDATIDEYPYTASSTSLSSALFPTSALEGGRTQVLERLKDPAKRGTIKKEIARAIQEERGGGDPKNVVLASCTWDPSLAGKNLADVSRLRGLPATVDGAADAAMWIVEHGECQGIFHAIGEEDLERILKHPATMIGSDGEIPIFGRANPHPRSYGTFARVLGVYVRERRALSLHEAIRKMTSFPAQRLGLSDRGLLRTGMKADIVVFDPARVRDAATFEAPHQYAEGVSRVLTNGQVVFENRAMTTARPGVVLYGPGHSN
jgi:N-acyl-D-amino-acid deacylase